MQSRINEGLSSEIFCTENEVVHPLNYLLDRMIRASGWGISVLEPLIWLSGVFIKVCLFLCLDRVGGGGSSTPPPCVWRLLLGKRPLLHHAPPRKWVMSLRLWDYRPSGRRVPGRFLSVMFRPYHPPPPPPFSVKEKQKKKNIHSLHHPWVERTPNALRSSLME